MHRTCFTLAAACFLSASLLSASEPAADWHSWRGPHDSGSVETGTFPERLDDAATVWKVSLPGKGCSTPIVVGGRVYVTAPIAGKDSLLAFDPSGKPLWQTEFSQENPGKHRNGSGCNASPVSDGTNIFVYFKSGTLAAVSPAGKILWQTDIVERFGQATLYWDHGTSPVLTTGHVILARMHNGESWVAAFDKTNGDLTWKTERNYQTPQEGDHGYATPLIIRHAGQETILTWGAEHLTMHNAADGKLVWSCGNFNPDAEKLWPSISTPVIVDHTAVIAFGRNDRGKPRLHGIKLIGSGDVTDSSHAWTRDDTGTFVPSPISYKGQVYLLRDAGEVDCLDPESGKTVWTGRFPKNRAKFYASPIIAGDKLYAPREDGVVFVASVAGGKFELLSENDMQEPMIGSPVPVANRIYLRGEQHLFCLGQ